MSTASRRKKTTDSILSVFQTVGLTYFVVKGGVVAEYYPHWQYRTMGDVDVIVENKNKANEIMMQMGFEPISLPDDHEWTYKQQNFEIEIHDDLIYDNDDVAYDEAKSFFRNYREHVKNNSIDINFHFAYLFLHLRKHFMKRGVGFRQFLDIALMVKNCAELDWNVVESYLIQSNLFTFAQTVCKYNERWFGVTSPFERTEITTSIYDESTEFIFKNGVFGFDNNETSNQIQVLRCRENRFRIAYMCKDALHRVFLPYKSIIELDYCSFIIDRPFLLPVAWIKRIVFTMTNKGIETGMRQISRAFVSKKYIDRNEEMFRNWGL